MAEVFALIPARAGSSGIVNKNIADLGGHPLLAYSIQAALSCPYITRTLVSTDCERIAAIAREYGAEVPFLRPADIAGATAQLGEAITHARSWLRREESYEADAAVLLLPTHPFRSKDLMNELTSRLVQGCWRVRTVKRVDVSMLSHFVMEDGAIASLHGDHKRRVCYRPYGLYAGHLLKRQTVQSPSYYKEISTLGELIDIDVPEDLALANTMLDKGLVQVEWA